MHNTAIFLVPLSCIGPLLWERWKLGVKEILEDEADKDLMVISHLGSGLQVFPMVRPVFDEAKGLANGVIRSIVFPATIMKKTDHLPHEVGERVWFSWTAPGVVLEVSGVKPDQKDELTVKMESVPETVYDIDVLYVFKRIPGIAENLMPT
ncbi:MAG: hypothetical protein PHF79_00875 [Candidatus Pacebacteria bacterium]|nr:hypothetical protein [Candidatus Paceibacterota bacterium]